MKSENDTNGQIDKIYIFETARTRFFVMGIKLDFDMRLLKLLHKINIVGLVVTTTGFRYFQALLWKRLPQLKWFYKNAKSLL